MESLSRKHASRSERLALTVAAYAGAFGIGGQILIVRELMTIAQGNELTIGLLLALYLLWGAAGSWFSAKVLSRSRRTPHILVAMTLLASISLPAALFAISLSRVLLGMGPTEMLSVAELAVVTVPAVSPYCFFSGAILPLVVGVASVHEPRRSAVRTYMLETAGSGVGALAISVLLLPYLPAGRLALAMSAGAAGCGLLLAGHMLRGRSRIALGVLAGSLAAGFALASASDRIESARKEAQWEPLRFLASHDSHFGHLDAVALGDQVSVYRDGALVSTLGDREAAFALARMALLQSPRAERVLLLGGGFSGFIEAFKKLGVESVDLVEIDPDLVPFVEDAIGPGATGQFGLPGVRMHIGDPRVHATSSPDPYDIVLVVQSEPASLSQNRFFTREFYRILSGTLRRDGVLVFAVECPDIHVSGERGRFLASLMKTVRSAFARVELIPGPPCTVVASNAPGFVLDQGLDAPEETQGYYTSLFRRDQSFARGRLNSVLKRFEATVLPNLDYFPMGYVYSLTEGTNRFLDPFPRVTTFLTSLDTSKLFLIPALLLVLVLASILRSPASRAAAGLAVVATGMSGMAIQVVILFSFQIVHGSVFYQVGIQTSLFMIGLSIGAFLASRFDSARATDAPRILLAAMTAVAVLPVLVRLVLVGTRPDAFLFAAASVLAGASAGLAFPAASTLWRRQGSRPASAFGILYALDLLGACVGSLVIGPLLVALLGIAAACDWLALVNLACLCGVWWRYRGELAHTSGSSPGP